MFSLLMFVLQCLLHKAIEQLLRQISAWGVGHSSHTCDHMAITQFPTPLLNTSVPRISRRSMVVTVVEHSWLSFGAPSLREPSSTPRIRIASASHLPRNQVQPSGTLDARLDPVSATGSTGCWTRSHGLCHRPDRAGWDEVEMTGELSADTARGWRPSLLRLENMLKHAQHISGVWDQHRGWRKEPGLSRSLRG